MSDFIDWLLGSNKPDSGVTDASPASDPATTCPHSDAYADCKPDATDCKLVSGKGTPINPKGPGRKINMWGEQETPGFEDWAAENTYAKYSKDCKDIVRPVSSDKPAPPGLPDKCASDICIRSSPMSKATVPELQRIAKEGCRITYAAAEGGFDAQKEKLLAAFPKAKIVDGPCGCCTSGSAKMKAIVIEV